MLFLLFGLEIPSSAPNGKLFIQYKKLNNITHIYYCNKYHYKY